MPINPEHSEFARLIAQHERTVQGYILANVPRWGDADEIWQETSVRLWIEFEKYESGSNFAAWATRVAHFEILTWRKRISRSKLIFSQEFVDAIAADQDLFSSEQTRDRLQALDHCLENSSDAQRLLLARFYEPNRKVSQLAKEMNCSVDSVYKAAHRIRKSLRQCIELRLRNAEIGT